MRGSVAGQATAVTAAAQRATTTGRRRAAGVQGERNANGVLVPATAAVRGDELEVVPDGAERS